MSALVDLIKFIIEQMAPAVAVALWNYEESKVGQARASQELAEVKLQLEKNHESVDAKYLGKSDLDVVNDAVFSDGGGQLGAGDGTGSPAPGDNPGKKDS